MVARLQKLLLKIALLEHVFKYSRIVYIPRRMGYWGAYTIFIV